MHYTALQNYSVSAGRPPAQKAPAMAATYSISAASGELMIPENAGVVLQAKSGINAIRVSGTATTTAGMTGPGTTANQIQFYSNDTIVGAFDRLGLCTNSIQIGTSNQFLVSKGSGNLAGNIVIGDTTSGGNLTGAGTNNVIIGSNNAGSKITTGSANVAIGWGSMGNGVTTSNSNTCVGPLSGFNLTSGEGLNTLIGQNAGGNMTSGYRNTGLGAGALGNATHTGSNNIGIGVDAGYNITTGYDNICIGRSSTISAAGNNNEIVIGAGMTGNGSGTTTIANKVFMNDTLNVTHILANSLTCRLNSDTVISSYNASSNFSNNIVFQCKSSNGANLGKTIAFFAPVGFAMNSARSDGDANVITINTQPDSNGGYTMIINNGFAGATSSHCLRLNNNLAANGVAAIDCMAGVGIQPTSGIHHIKFSYNGSSAVSVTQLGSTVNYNSSSDLRLKENLDYNFNAIDILNQLKPVQFNFINQPDIHYGFIAQEVLQILPQYVSTSSGGDSYYQMDYSKFTGILCKAIKEQQTEISELKSQLASLKSIVDNLKK
jgi:hypothetical protein